MLLLPSGEDLDMWPHFAPGPLGPPPPPPTLMERLLERWAEFNNWFYMLDGRAVALAAFATFCVVLLAIALTHDSGPVDEE